MKTETMKTETYVFRDLSMAIRGNWDGKRDRLIRGMVAEIAEEFKYYRYGVPEIVATAMDEKGHNLHITFQMHRSFYTHYLWGLLNNTYGATTP